MLASALLDSASVDHALAQVTLPQVELHRQEELRRAILTYCAAHPDAKDTAEGIVNWWFPATSPPWSHAEVKQALDGLIAEGWLTRRKLRQSNAIYSVNKEKIAEIENYLSRSASGAKPGDGD